MSSLAVNVSESFLLFIPVAAVVIRICIGNPAGCSTKKRKRMEKYSADFR